MRTNPGVRATVLLLALPACADDLAADPTSTAGATSTSTTTASGTTGTTGASPTTGGEAGSATTGEPAPTTSSTTAIDPSSPDESAGDTADTADTTDTADATGNVDGCGCEPGNVDIVVLSDDAELWTYSPQQDMFTYLTDVICPADKPYSLAIDRGGVAWIQFASDGEVYTFDPKHPAPCVFAGVSAKPAGFEYFGLSFAPDAPDSTCDRLYLMNYSGMGPFAEGPGLGALGVCDPDTLVVTNLGPVDYDGGELAGTGEGRLFAFAGVDPAKLIEFDRTDATPLSVLPLAGLRKTRASAFAFHGGDAWFFTEAVATTCHPCLESQCPTAFDACQTDPTCADALACSLALGDIQDECGGLMTAEMIDCATGACSAACYPATDDVFSQVTRLDYDDSEGNNQVLTQVNPEAPIRIVGAAASTCAPYLPQ